MTSIAYLILNGPRGSGKANAARCIAQELRGMGVNAIQDTFSMPIKHFFATALGDKYQTMDKYKDKPRPEFAGHSLRSCYDDFAKDYLRLRFGNDVLGRWLIHRSLRDPKNKPEAVVVSDGWYWPDVDVVPNKYVVQILSTTHTYIGYPNPDMRLAPTPDFIDYAHNIKEISNSFIKEMGIRNGHSKGT